MLEFIMYLIVGWLTIFGTLLIHFAKAETKGYAALDWWVNYIDTNPDNCRIASLEFIWGLLIWPYRWAAFVLSLDEFYSVYDRKN